MWVIISTYVDNGTAKLPILGKIGPVSQDQPPKSGNIHDLIQVHIMSGTMQGTGRLVISLIFRFRFGVLFQSFCCLV